MISLRRYHPQDTQEITQLFHDTIHHINKEHYTPEQIAVWAPENFDLKAWNQRLSIQYCLVAVIDTKIVGFGSIETSGYLDMLYVHKDFQHQGIASKLCDELESIFTVPSIYTHASITAKTFFTTRGYKTITEQIVELKGISFINYRMEKTLF